MEGTRRVGIVGTGFIGRGLALALEGQPDVAVSKVLTRRDPRQCKEHPRRELLTNSVEELVEASEVVVECSGDVIHGTEVLDRVLAAPLPAVTMNSELQVTTGSYLAGKGLITEAEGDQPGCLASLRENALQMGFRPLVYGNVKGFLNHTPTREEMEHWSEKQGISLQQVTSATDGTKVQFEQALVANGLGAGIAEDGLLGVPCEELQEGATALAEEAKSLGHPISDYILSPKSPKGVFIVAEHDERQRDYLRYFKLGDGPYYVLLQSFFLCHLEIVKTIRRVLKGEGVLINNTARPSVSVAAVAKRPLKPGETIRRGIGSFEVRGSAIRMESDPGHVPIGLLADAVVRRKVEAGRRLSFDEVEVPESLALRAWLETQRALKKARPR